MSKQKVQVLSPDGITIEFDKWSYPSMKAANAAFERWKLRYVQQGYYSSNFTRIPLDQLREHCEFVTI